MLMQRHMFFLNDLFFGFIAALIAFSQLLMYMKWLTEAQTR